MGISHSLSLSLSLSVRSHLISSDAMLLTDLCVNPKVFATRTQTIRRVEKKNPIDRNLFIEITIESINRKKWTMPMNHWQFDTSAWRCIKLNNNNNANMLIWRLVVVGTPEPTKCSSNSWAHCSFVLSSNLSSSMCHCS